MYRRGWIRVVEASLAVLIVLGVLFSLYIKESQTADPSLGERARAIIEEEATKPSFRAAVFANDSISARNAVAAHINDSTIAFEVRICELDSACGKSTYTAENVYAAERVLSSSLNLQPPQGGGRAKKVRLFLWRVHV